MNHYSQLTQEQRYHIYGLQKAGIPALRIMKAAAITTAIAIALTTVADTLYGKKPSG